ncbi:MAG: hypothetical protein JXA66_04530 [Oligoflexia bacterium]|nr:hypothetical protein [Oligoflexia bacterium]
MRKNLAAPNVYLIFLITIIIFFSILVASLGNKYATGRIINKDKKPASMLKVCIPGKKGTNCSLSNRYGKFTISDVELEEGSVTKLIIRDQSVIREIRIEISQKKLSGLNTVFDIGEIVLDF